MIAIMIESRLISNILQDYFIIFPMFFQLQRVAIAYYALSSALQNLFFPLICF